MADGKNQINTVDTGLANVPVCTSAISHTTVDGKSNPILLYRGYSIYELVKGSFEESAYLILNSELPTQTQLDTFSAGLRENRALDAKVIEHMKTYPKHANMMDTLLTTLSFARMSDRDYNNDIWQNPKADPQKLVDLIKNVGIRMGAKIPTIIAYGHSIKNGRGVIAPYDRLSHAANILYMLDIRPEEELVKAIDISLILYLDHTLNCSTFTARVAESAGVDPYGPLLAASVSLKGVLHGGANEMAAKMFDEIKTPDRAKQYVLGKLGRKELVIGFGHRLQHYKGGIESRVKIAEGLARHLAKEKGMGYLFEIYDILVEVMQKEKGLAQNLDLPTSILYNAIGIHPECNTPIFQASRHFGWIAHMAEQRLGKCPLYRPTQEYTGPNLDNMRKYTPINQRGG